MEASTLPNQVFRIIKTEGPTYEEYERTLSCVLKSVAAIPDVTEGNRVEAAWLLLLQAYHTLSESEVKMAHQKIEKTVMKSTQKVRDGIMGREHSYAAQLKREGQKLGMELGKDLGIRESLLLLIETKFGQPSAAMIEQIDSVDLDTVTDWIRQIVTVDSLDELGILPRA